MERMTVNGREYRVLRLLGKGKGGYSYLVTDGAGEYVLKQIHHEPCDYYQFGDKLVSELRDYERLRRIGISMPQLLAVDRAQERLLKTYVPGDTVAELVRRGRMEPAYLRQMEEMCRLLYAANTNIDYYPTNFVVWQGELFYIDFECNDYSDRWNFENWGKKYWSDTPEFREHFGGNSMRYTDLIFDLYGTLVDIHTEETDLVWEKTALYFGFYGAHYTGPELKTAFQAALAAREAKAGQSYECFPDIPFEQVMAELFRAKGVEEAADALGVNAAQLFCISSLEYIRLYPGTLETLAELTEAAKAFEFCDIAEISVAKPRTLGRYHLMTAQNPVYIFTMQNGGGENG